MPIEFHAPEDDPERVMLRDAFQDALKTRAENLPYVLTELIFALEGVQKALDAETWTGPQELRDEAHELGAAVDVVLGYLKRPDWVGGLGWRGWDGLTAEVESASNPSDEADCQRTHERMEEPLKDMAKAMDWALDKIGRGA